MKRKKRQHNVYNIDTIKFSTAWFPNLYFGFTSVRFSSYKMHLDSILKTQISKSFL